MLRQDTNWWHTNAQALERRLVKVAAAPDGIIYHAKGQQQDVMVWKDEGVLYLYFNTALSMEVQSRMRLGQPLHLLSPYSQLMLMSLLWQPQPARVFVLGLGGGRLPLVLHHVLPGAQVQCVEIDAQVPSVAQRFFGLLPDARLRIAVQDGRQWLQTQAQTYDIIMLDGFVGNGTGPRRLSTVEFYAACRQRLAPGGVVAANFLADDREFQAKLATMRASFAHVYHAVDGEWGNHVLFGMLENPYTLEQLQARAQQIAQAYSFSFDYRARAGLLHYNPGAIITGLELYDEA